MTAHTCIEFSPYCYRCELGRDEEAAVHVEVLAEAQAAWLAYRNDYSRRNHLNPRRAASQMRRREFIAGYLAANDITTA